MNNQDYTLAIEIPASPETVFNHIREIPKWWSKDFEGSTAKPGDEFVICHPGLHYSRQRLIEAIPGKKLVWLVNDSTLNWLKGDQQDWTNTKLIFELTARGDKTLINFTHQGLVPEKESYSRCIEGWNTVIKNHLFNFITAGKTI